MIDADLDAARPHARHPLGTCGARVLGTLAHRLRDGGGRWGGAAICIGVGQALAVVVENAEDAERLGTGG